MLSHKASPVFSSISIFPFIIRIFKDTLFFIGNADLQREDKGISSSASLPKWPQWLELH